MPTCLFIALWLAIFAFTRPGLRGLNRCCINDVYAPLRQDNVFGMQRWSQKFGPLVKMDQLMGKMIQNDKEKEPFA